jgi:branched-chain amino acid transport system ATP-binding protein
MAGALRTERASFASDLLALPPSRRAEREAFERARATLVRLGLEHIGNVPANALPFGQRRRVELARAIAADPWLLLVDEPAAGLNHSERATLHDDLLALRASGTTLLLIEHDMKLVMTISDRVMVLKFGRKIADGKPAAVRSDAEVVAAYLGTAS